MSRPRLNFGAFSTVLNEAPWHFCEVSFNVDVPPLRINRNQPITLLHYNRLSVLLNLCVAWSHRSKTDRKRWTSSLPAAST